MGDWTVDQFPKEGGWKGEESGSSTGTSLENNHVVSVLTVSMPAIFTLVENTPEIQSCMPKGIHLPRREPKLKSTVRVRSQRSRCHRTMLKAPG